jgi:hypothetical protein
LAWRTILPAQPDIADQALRCPRKRGHSKSAERNWFPSITAAAQGKGFSPWIALEALGVLPVGRGVGAIARGARAARAPESPFKAARAARLAEHETKAATAAETPPEALKGRRTLRVGEKVQQLPSSRSQVTKTLIERPADVFSAKHPELWYVGAQARVAKAAGRETRLEAERAQAAMVHHANALPKEGSKSDLFHFWAAQLPKSHRNAKGIRLVVQQQADELQRISSGEALKDLQRQQTAIQAKLDAKGAVEEVSSDALAPGVLVRAADRDNVGRVVSVRGDKAQVHVVNRAEGTEATVELPTRELASTGLRQAAGKYQLTGKGERWLVGTF